MSDPFKILSHALKVGLEVEAELGTFDDHSIIFRGRTYKVEAGFPQDDVPTLKLHAYDNSMKMGLRPRNRPWTDTTLSDIVSHIADDYFWRQNIRLQGNPLFEENGIRQQNETDLAFLLRLAAEFGCEMYVYADELGDTFHFVSQYDIMTADPEVTLYHKRCDVPHQLLSFEASGDISNIQLPRIFSGMVYKSGLATEVAEAPVREVGDQEDAFYDENLVAFHAQQPPRATQLQNLIAASAEVQNQVRKELGSVRREAIATFTTQETLQEQVKNQYSTSIYGMRASGTTVGNHRIHAQTNIYIADVGDRFSGTWYLSQVRHILNGQGYQTEFQCRR